jgi:hypothetical protein
MTANLQSPMTVRQAARLMNVSERSVYMAGRILREAPDLEPEINAGRLSLHAATRLLDERQGRARSVEPALRKAWRLASPEERGDFVVWLADVLGAHRA